MKMMSIFLTGRRLYLSIVAIPLALASTLALMILVPTGFVFLATLSLGYCFYVAWRLLLRFLFSRTDSDRH